MLSLRQKVQRAALRHLQDWRRENQPVGHSAAGSSPVVSVLPSWICVRIVSAVTVSGILARTANDISSRCRSAAAFTVAEMSENVCNSHGGQVTHDRCESPYASNISYDPVTRIAIVNVVNRTRVLKPAAFQVTGIACGPIPNSLPRPFHSQRPARIATAPNR